MCIGVHIISLSFYKPVDSPALVQQWNPGATISIEAGFRLRRADGSHVEATPDTLASVGGGLTVLLGESILATERLAENELLVQFSNGIELHLLTDAQGFESYHITIDGDSVDITKPF